MRYNIAGTLATYLNDPEAALTMLGPVLERGTGVFVKHAATDPDLAILRGDPRFPAMLAAAQARLAAAERAASSGAAEPA
jgi:hypothetical protein